MVLTAKLGAAALAKPKMRVKRVDVNRAVFLPKESLTVPQTGAPTHIPANTMLFS